MSGAVVAGLVLAGGRGRRLGASGPKPLVALAGRALIEHVLDRFSPRVAPILLAANDPVAFAAFGLPIVADRVAGVQGPLAGLDAGAAWLRRNVAETTHLLALPGDTPFLPRDLCDRMIAVPGLLPRIASAGGRRQPTVGLWPLAVLDRLPAYLAGTHDRSLMGFAGKAGFEDLAFQVLDDTPGGNPFFNINTAEQLREARAFFEA